MALRVGIMSVAHMHAFSYASAINALPQTVLAGIADDDAARGAEAARGFGCPRYATYEELLGAPLDAVVIGSENVRHRRLAELAAAAGKHVLCEKPLATTVADAQAMVDACASAGVQLMTAFPCRFSPAMVRLRDAVLAGQIGEVVAIRGTNRGRCPFGWFVDRALSGGGAVIDHTVHVTDLMRWLLGAEVTSVYAEVTNRMFGRDFDDTGFLCMDFENGVFATLDSSWSRPKAFPTWGDVTLAVVGRRGTISLDMFAQSLVLYSDSSGATTWHPWGTNIDEQMIAAFAAAIASGSPVPVTGVDGLRAVAVALAAYESAAAGAPVAPREAV